MEKRLGSARVAGINIILKVYSKFYFQLYPCIRFVHKHTISSFSGILCIVVMELNFKYHVVSTLFSCLLWWRMASVEHYELLEVYSKWKLKGICEHFKTIQKLNSNKRFMLSGGIHLCVSAVLTLCQFDSATGMNRDQRGRGSEVKDKEEIDLLHSYETNTSQRRAIQGYNFYFSRSRWKHFVNSFSISVHSFWHLIMLKFLRWVA